MAQPTPYTTATNFASDERNNAGGRSTVRTDRVDAELAAIQVTLRETLVNLALIQRDDGRLRDAAVELYNLTAACRLALGTDINPRGLWATATAYVANDLIDRGGAGYICPVGMDHTSGDFATDYAAGKWQAFGSITTAAGVLFTPPSTMTATDVQAAIEEIDTLARNTSLAALANSYGAL
jgi:hypothetical protein